MSIFNVYLATVVAFQYVHPDPRQPTGMWFHEQTSAGDVSGGYIGIGIQFPKKWLETHVATLEEANQYADVATNPQVRITRYLGSGGTGVPISLYGQASLAVAGLGVSTQLGRDNGYLPMYIAFARPLDPGVSGDLTVVSVLNDANTNAKNYDQWAWGFWWEVKRGNL